ncbi:MAG TPA: hypothetical protein VHK91_09540 [Flavisolibacter sp.]|jgi:hypothetical protein|nr:hypothetical protein [Flavisolibacter sp.]
MGFLVQKASYVIPETLDSVESQIQALLDNPWYDFSINLRGESLHDHVFILKTKFTFGLGAAFPFNLVLLEGKLIETGFKQTTIKTETKLSFPGLVILLVLIVCVLFNFVNLIMGYRDADWSMGLTFLIMTLAYSFYASFSIKQLKKRFEKTMNFDSGKAQNWL